MKEYKVPVLLGFTFKKKQKFPASCAALALVRNSDKLVKMLSKEFPDLIDITFADPSLPESYNG